jgi:hypothetical protein
MGEEILVWNSRRNKRRAFEESSFACFSPKEK